MKKVVIDSNSFDDFFLTRTTFATSTRKNKIVKTVTYSRVLIPEAWFIETSNLSNRKKANVSLSGRKNPGNKI